MNDLNLSLKSDKKEYLVDEPINILVSLKNQTNDGILINNRFLCAYEEDDDKEFYFQVFDSNGDRYDIPENNQADILPVPIRESNMQMLAPDESIQQSINFSLLHKLKKGEYKVLGKYQSTPFKNTKEIYSKTITSDTIDLIIK